MTSSLIKFLRLIPALAMVMAPLPAASFSRIKDLADVEKFELQLLSGYLPQQMNDGEISQAVDGAIAEAKPTGIKDMGKVMALLKPRLAGKADIGKVSNLVKNKLSG